MGIFRTQRLVNKFPLWSKVRSDPSSLGARFLSVFAEYYDFRNTELLKMKREMNLLKPHLGRGNSWNVQLVGEDQLPVEITTGGDRVWTYPTTVVGTHALGDKTLVRVEDIEALLWSPPDEVSLAETIPTTDFLIWTSAAPTVFNVMSYPERLEIVVENSMNYFARSPVKNREASGKHLVEIEGKDINGIPFTEHVTIVDDGVYRSRTIVSEVTAVRSDGFSGDLLLYLNTPTTATTRKVIDMYHLGVSDNTEGPLELALVSDVLTYNVRRILAGVNYRKGGDKVVDNYELFWEQELGDTVGGALTGFLDLAINLETSRLYALQDNGTIWVYDHGLTPFNPPASIAHTVTKNTFIEINPLRPWALLNENMRMHTMHTHPRFPVVDIEIMRRSPAGVEEYLQADRTTWAAGVVKHSGSGTENVLPEESWADFGFDSLFDEYGQWEFYCITRTIGGSSVTYMGVMVDKLTAVAELATGVAMPTGMYFSENGQLCVTDAANVYRFEEHGHFYFASGAGQRLLLREEYTNVEVTL